MASFRFIGDPRDGFSGPDLIEYDGVKFDRLEFVSVPDYMADKLRGNNHFEEFSGRVDPVASEAQTAYAPFPIKRGWPAGKPRKPH